MNGTMLACQMGLMAHMPDMDTGKCIICGEVIHLTRASTKAPPPEPEQPQQAERVLRTVEGEVLKGEYRDICTFCNKDCPFFAHYATKDVGKPGQRHAATICRECVVTMATNLIMRGSVPTK